MNIAIEYHNTNRSLKSVALEYEMSAANVGRIHDALVRHISRCLGLTDCYFYTSRKNHSEDMSLCLQEYRCLLEENELRTEITLNDTDGKPSVILSSCLEPDSLIVKIFNQDIYAEISMDELKAALRKLSVK